METELIINRIGLPPLSARGCVQELVPLALGQFRRTVNGDLVFLGTEGKKYKSNISCEDKAVIAVDDLCPGMIVEVSCIQRLWQKVEGEKVMLERMPVPGSIISIDEDRDPVSIVCYDGREVTLNNKKSAFVSYRPLLKMRVIRYVLTTDEWGVKAGWRLELEEV